MPKACMRIEYGRKPQSGCAAIKTNKFMHNSTKQRTLLFVTVATLALLFGFGVIYHLGFGEMARAEDAKPERLRDFTFPLWHQYSWLKHGYLTFLTADGYAKGEAYANQPTLYLWMMRALYQVQLIFPKLTMRISGAVLSMCASLVAIGYAIPKPVWEKLTLRHGVLMILAFSYFLTIPTFWISLGKFNVDNDFVFIFPVLLVTSHLIATDGPCGARFWTSAILLCVFTPTCAALFGAFLGLRAISLRHVDGRMLRSAIIMIIVAVIVYLQPVIVLKLLRFSSTDSTWLFRSGLDGDMTYYGNFINSVFFPQFNRSAYLIVMPAALLILQLWYRWKFNVAPEASVQIDRPDAMMPYLFSVYVLCLLFWPQAISIHPYLYDVILVGPVGAWVVLNFTMPEIHQRHFLFWVLLLLFLITFNLTKIAQGAHCSGCYFPGWDMVGARAG